jgi:DNA polymerase III epsilon subunit-like protein
MSILYLDTETNGVGNFRPPTQRLIQLAWIYKVPKTYYIKDVTEIAENLPHKITIEQCRKEGVDFDEAFAEFYNDFSNASSIVAHNLDFDIGIIKNELKLRNSDIHDKFKAELKTKQFQCTMKDSVQICKLKFNDYSKNFKFPKLTELYFHYYQSLPDIEPHDALNDCYILKMCHQKMTS